MKLYIPKVTDTLILSKEWEFKLFQEYRNSKMYSLYPEQIKNEPRVERIYSRKIRFPSGEVLPSDFGIPLNMYGGFSSDYRIRNCESDDPGAYLTRQFVINNYIFQEYDKFGSKFSKVKLPINSILTVSRVYITKQHPRFNSITFVYNGTLEKPLKKGKPRFWAKLEDVNNIEFYGVEDSIEL